MQNFLEYILFSFFSKLFCLAGFKRAHIFVPFLAFIFHDLLKLRLKVVLKNLQIAFPEMSEHERKILAKKCYISSAKTFIEIMALPAMKYEEVEGYFGEEPVKFVQKYHAMGKGVILMTAHFGNWEMAALTFSRRVGVPFAGLAQPQRNGFVTKWMEEQRTRWGNKIYKTGNAAMTLFRALKNGEIIAVVGDQRGPEDGIRVPFFGRASAVNEGIAVLALKTGAPILFSITIRQSDNSYITEVCEVSTEDLPEGKQEKIVEISRRHTAILEGYIRKYPEQWFWMHNRWKY